MIYTGYAKIIGTVRFSVLYIKELIFIQNDDPSFVMLVFTNCEYVFPSNSMLYIFHNNVIEYAALCDCPDSVYL